MPTITAPAARNRSTDGGVVRGPPTFEDPRRTRGRQAARRHVVLDRDRHAGERARVGSGRDLGVDRVGRGACLVGEDEVERVDLTFARVDACQVLLEHVACGPRAGANGGGDLDRGHGASPRMRGTRKRPSSAAGAAASTSSRVDTRTHGVRAQHVDERQRVRGRLHSVGVECRDLRGVVEDRAELTA